MALFTNSNTRRWWWIVGVGVLVVVAWGTYAWKIADEPRTAPLNSPRAETDTPIDEGETDRQLTTLSARNAPVNNRVTDLTSSARANAPVSIDDALTASLDPVPPPARVTPTPVAPVAAQKPPVAPRRPPPVRDSLVVRARKALGRGQMITARSLFSRALADGLPEPEATSIRKELTGMSRALLLSRANTNEDPLTGTHIISSGESLHVIAKRTRISVPLLMSINQIENAHRIRAGERLKIIRGPFCAVISKSLYRMDIYLGDTFVRSFDVGLGTNGGTPLGDWVVGDKLENPDWTDPRTNQHFAADDPENPIGERWIKLDCVAGGCLGRVGFGIHGTIDPGSIGANRSMGCVRMTPSDVAEVYDLLVRNHSRVQIIP